MPRLEPVQVVEEPGLSMIELAFEGLRRERADCVDRLSKAISAAGQETEVEDYLRRISCINASFVRLAGAHIAG